METYKSIQEVKSNSIHVELPLEFHAKKVEVTISAVHEANRDLTALQKVLLEAPTLTDDELEQFDIARKWMNQWNSHES